MKPIERMGFRRDPGWNSLSNRLRFNSSHQEVPQVTELPDSLSEGVIPASPSEEPHHTNVATEIAGGDILR